MCTPELTDRERKAVNHEITVGWHGKREGQFLSEQLCHLQKSPSGPIKPGPTAKLGEKVPIVAFHKGIPGIFGIISHQFAADTQSNDFRVRHFCDIHISPLGNRSRDKLLVQIINNGINE